MEKLLNSIFEQHFDTIVMDASFVIRANYEFGRSELAKLAQVASHDCTIIMTDVVYREIIKNYADRIFKEINAASKPLDALLKYSIDELSGAKRLLEGYTKEKCSEIAKCHLDNYIAEHNIDVISTSDYLDISVVIDNYFNANPPFSVSEKKKNEFPDAFSLYSIDAYVKKNGCKAFVVSTDGDWHEFAKGKDNIYHIDNISSVLHVLNTQAQKGQYFAKMLSNYVDSERSINLKESIEFAVDCALEKSSVEFNVVSHMSYECELDYISATLDKFETVNENKDGEKNYFKIISEDDDCIQLSCTVIVDAVFSYSIDFYVWDSIDKENIPMGLIWQKTERQLRINIDLKFDWISPDEDFNPMLLDAEAESRHISLNLGWQDPFKPELDEEYD